MHLRITELEISSQDYVIGNRWVRNLEPDLLNSKASDKAATIHFKSRFKLFYENQSCSRNGKNIIKKN